MKVVGSVINPLLLFSCRYAHFDERMCPLFRTEDYLPPKTEEVDLPDQEQQLENLIISKCPRCGQVGLDIMNTLK